MEHLVKFYKEIALGYMLLIYDGRKSFCTSGPLPFPSKKFQISLLAENDGNNAQKFLNQIPQK
jgi:eukaryotic translation initiation factor 2C